MVGNALVGFRRGTIDLLRGDVSYQNMGFIFGIPNARMSSCPCFQHFPPLACLDNSVSGIPNAIPAGLPGGRAQCRGRRGMGAFTGHREHRLKCAGNGPEIRARCQRAKKSTSRRKPMSNSKDAVRKILDSVKADKRTSLTAPEGKLVCDACGIPVPKEGVAKSAAEAARLATDIGFPVVMKIVSPDILHKTEAGRVMVGVKTAADVAKNYATILPNPQKCKSD